MRIYICSIFYDYTHIVIYFLIIRKYYNPIFYDYTQILNGFWIYLQGGFYMAMNISGFGNTYNNINPNSKQYKPLKEKGWFCILCDHFTNEIRQITPCISFFYNYFIFNYNWNPFWYTHSYFELQLPSSDHAVFPPPPV